MSISQGLPTAGETISLNNSSSNAVVAVAVPPQKDGMPSTSDRFGKQLCQFQRKSPSPLRPDALAN